MKTVEKRLLKLADEIALGPSGDRQQDIAVELRAIVLEMEVSPEPEVETPKKRIQLKIKKR